MRLGFEMPTPVQQGRREMDEQISTMACSDMRNGRTVKGVHFVEINNAGDPVECEKACCKAGTGENGDKKRGDRK